MKHARFADSVLAYVICLLPANYTSLSSLICKATLRGIILFVFFKLTVNHFRHASADISACSVFNPLNKVLQVNGLTLFLDLLLLLD
jgi:hypothetical protein